MIKRELLVLAAWPLGALRVALRRTLAFWSRNWLLTIQLSAMLILVGLIFRVAHWEPFSEGFLAIFLLLALPSAALLLGTRRSLSISFAIGGILLLIEGANKQKVELLKQNLHIFDALSLWAYLTEDKTIVELYWKLAVNVIIVFGAFILVFIILRIIENRGFYSSRNIQGSRMLLICFGVAAIINVFIFATGNYFWATSNEFIYSWVGRHGPPRFSDLFASLVDVVRVEKELSTRGIKSSAKAAKAPKGLACSKCPNIITVHVESVFDPAIVRDFDNSPPITTFFSPRLISSNGPLLTLVTGGWSVISEFSFNCGLDHRIFEISGLNPNFFLPRRINRCIPGYLRDQGYITQIVSSAPYGVMRIGAAYSAYGVDIFSGPETLSSRPLHWLEMRDGLFVDAAIKRLERPRTAPRLLELLTTINHGPHGPYRPDQYPAKDFSGPYDLESAKSEELRDYVSRLNDSITAFRRLEEFIAASDVPTLIVYYGDHQPSFKMDYSSGAVAHFGKDAIRHLTFYRIARNFGKDSPASTDILPLDQLFGEALASAGIKLPPELLTKDRIARECPNGILTCAEAKRRAMRALILK